MRQLRVRSLLVLGLIATAPADATLMPASLPATALAANLSSARPPAIAVHPTGVALVVGARNVGGGDLQVIGRFFDASGKPRAGEIAISDNSATSAPAVAVDSDGRFWVVWSRFDTGALESVLTLQRFDAAGNRIGPETDLVEPDGSEQFAAPLVSCPAAGGCIVAWVQLDSTEDLYGQLFSTIGLPLRERFQLDGGPVLTRTGLGLAASSDGRFAVSWLRAALVDVPSASEAGSRALTTLFTPIVRLFQADGDAATDEIALDTSGLGRNATSTAVAVAWNAFGEVLAVWDRRRPLGPGFDVRGQLLQDDGQATGPLLQLNDETLAKGAALEWDPTRGGFVAAWPEATADPLQTVGPAIVLRALGDDGLPLGNELRVVRRAIARYRSPAVASSSSGRVWTTWFAGNGTDTVAEAASFEASESPCPGGASTCAHLGPEGRLQARVAFRDQAGEPRLAGATALTPLAGGFFFNSPQNPELLAKIVDGRTLNGAFWLFAGALSDQEYSLGVFDEETGASRIYYNAPGTLASFGDTSAFPAPPARGEDPISTRASGPCANDATLLCLNDGQFRVQLLWTDAGGVERAARPAAFGGQGGSFYYFNPDNVEVAMKILDGRPINGKFWVFYASLTNVRFRLRVLNAQGQLLKQYVNPPSTFASVADTSAF